MENRSYALMTGLFTLSLLVAAIIISLWLNRDRVERVPFQIATTRSVSGLSPQAPIRFRGLEVGRVHSIAFDQAVPGQILIKLSINPDAPITRSTWATLGFQGVTGIAFIQLNDDGREPVRVASNQANPARIELRASIFDKLESHGSLILTQAEELTRRLNEFLTPDNQKTIITMFKQATTTANKFESIPQQLEPTFAQLPTLVAQTQQTLGTLNKVAKEADVMMGNVNGLVTRVQAPDGALQVVTDTTRQVGSSLEQVLGQVQQHALPKATLLTEEARGTVRNLNQTISTLGEQPQSILFGAPKLAPGPGEAGFVAPGQ
jgi:phospholipid/cholesterol/gamma-HCH transport system substrate-binding protein